MARGELRVYLGAAAGVGKTYAMLNEGRRRRDYGEDVVIGFVEPHRRAKTAAQIGDLEVVPRKQMTYGGASFEEMDVDAILARQPEVAHVDELAHTNVPGSRNEKRWQDVEELLQAGITVIATLNIQHLESLNDVVEQITTVKQRETIPDDVVRRADEIQLVDLTPLALRNRLARGDVYPPERIDTALANYFRPGNLSALRELALLWVADQVDEGLAEYRERHGIEQPWETRERVLVALTGNTDGERLVRRAARIAQRAKGDLVGVHVRGADGLAAPSTKLLEKQREILEELGGTYHEVVAEDAGAALVEAARSLNATQIVMGASRRSRWSRVTRGSVIGRVIRESGVGIDVHVISHAEGTEDHQLSLPQTRRPAALPRRRLAIGLALAAVGPPLLTVLLAQLRDEVGLPSVLLLFLLLVVAVSAVGGLWPALAAAVSGFLLVNWYFTPPLYTFTIGEGENVLALVVFLAVAVIVSGFVALAARRAAEAAQTRAQAEALARLAGSSPVSVVLESLSRVLRLDGAAVLHREEGGWRVEAISGDNVPESPEAASATIDLDEEHLLAIVGPPLHSGDQRVLDAFARELAASVELGELEAEVEAAGAAAAANELRVAILSAVSDDLRTPISAIKGAVTRLGREDLEWTPEARRGFLDTIREEADRLDVLVANLLDMSRLQAGSLEVDVAPVSLDQVLSAALARVGIADGAVELDLPATLPRVLADGGLLERALANVIENAVRYSPTGKKTRITAGAVGSIVDVRVVDRADDVPREARGLGLPVARGFVEAMGGEIEAEDTAGGGLTVVTRLRTASEGAAASRRSS